MPVTPSPPPREALVYKIVSEADWRESERAGYFGGTAADVRDGFIHLSTAAQVHATASRHYAGVSGLLLVAVRPGGLGIRWEPSRGGEPFPHLYGELPLSAVEWVRPLPLGVDGRHLFPASL